MIRIVQVADHCTGNRIHLKSKYLNTYLFIEYIPYVSKSFIQATDYTFKNYKHRILLYIIYSQTLKRRTVSNGMVKDLEIYVNVEIRATLSPFKLFSINYESYQLSPFVSLNKT